MLGSLDASVSGMIAQRIRLTAIASNIANRDTILDANGDPNPYRRRFVVMAPGDPSAAGGKGSPHGVHIQSIELDMSEFNLREDPGSPYAIQDGPHKGYVRTPNIDPFTEQADALEAERAYEANIAAAEAAKSMVAQALRIIA